MIPLSGFTSGPLIIHSKLMLFISCGRLEELAVLQGYGYIVREAEICQHFLSMCFVQGSPKYVLCELPTTVLWFNPSQQ